MELIFQNKNLTIHRSIFEYLNSNMYVLMENQNALIIDPHKNMRVCDFLHQNNVQNVLILLTHEHDDHTSGISFFKRHFQNTILIATDAASDYLSDIKNARPILINFILEEQDKKNGTQLNKKFNQEFEPFCGKADIVFDENWNKTWNNHCLQLKKITGHSPGSCVIFLDNQIVFTGDSLMKDYPVLTRLPRGNKKDFKNKTLPFFETLNPNLNVFPGHGVPFFLKDLYKDGKLYVEFK